MKLTVLHLLLLLIAIVIIGYLSYKMYEGFENVGTVGPVCPMGSVLNKDNGQCYHSDYTGTDISQVFTTPICPPNMTYDQTKQLCVYPGASTPSLASTPTASDSCGNMVSLTGLLGLSGATSSMNGSAPTCPDGQTYDSNHELCIGISIPTCPSNQTFDTNQGICVDNTIPLTPIQSLSASKSCDSNMLQKIQEIVHNELLSQNGMTTGSQMAFLGQDTTKKSKMNDMDDSDSDDESPSNYQGKEYRRDCPKNSGKKSNNKQQQPPVPDMSKYIRKDSIPCWGCNVE
jgi:hypothetical protein